MKRSRKEEREVLERLPRDEVLANLGDFFSVIGDSTRIKILFSLSESELKVGAICEILKMEQSAISHQLKVLKNADLIRSRREGRSVIYSLSDDHVEAIIRYAYEHISEEATKNGKR